MSLAEELNRRRAALAKLGRPELVELVVDLEVERDVLLDDRANLDAKVEALEAEVDRHVVELNAWDEWANHLPSDIDLGGAVS